MCGPAAADSDIGGAAAVRSSSKSSAGESMAEHARPTARDQLPPRRRRWPSEGRKGGVASGGETLNPR